MPVQRVSNLDDPRLEPYRDLKSAGPGTGRFVAEGRFVVERLLASRFSVESILLTEERFRKLGDELPLETSDVYVLPKPQMKRLIGFDFHAGLMACGLRQPLATVEDVAADLPERATFAVCPRTTDPVNLGNVVRLCAAFGVRALLLGAGGADPFSRRVLRVSMGHVLRLPIVESNALRRDLATLRDEHGVELAAMVLDPAARPLETVIRPPRVAVLFGHEGFGLDAEWLETCRHRWTIPMAHGTDSLNVAASAAIVLHHLERSSRG